VIFPFPNGSWWGMVRIRFADFKTQSRQITLPRPSRAQRKIVRTARECLKRIPLVKKVRLSGVRLGGLVPHDRSGGREPRPVARPAA